MHRTHLARAVRPLGAVAAALTLTVTAGAQEVPLPEYDADAALERFSRDHGVELRSSWNFDTGYPSHLFGMPIDLGVEPSTDAEYEAITRDLLQTYPDLFGFDDTHLILNQVKRLNLRKIGTTDKTAVLYRQEVDGMPVEAGQIVFLFNEYGHIVSIDNQGMPRLGDIDIIPTVAEATGESLARSEVGNAQALRRSSDLSIIWSADRTGPVLAYSFDLRYGVRDDGVPLQERVSIDAHTGAMVRRESTVHTFTDLIGHLEGYGTPGVLPNHASNPPVLFDLKDARLSSAVGNTTSAANGDWTITYAGGANQTVEVNFGTQAPYVRVVDQAGPEISESSNVTPGNYTNIQMNSAQTDADTAEVNAHIGVIQFRDYVQGLDPTDTTFDFQVRANVNLSSTCNAFFDGSSINFYAPGGGCVNTCYSTVIAHEEGHWANVLYGTGNGSDGIGEGMADVWAMFIYDHPIVGEDFFGPGGGNIRTGNNTRPYCGSCGAGCHGGVHANGEVIMGAFWKARENLNATHGDAAGDLISDMLMLSWFQVYDDTTICTIIRDHLVVLDDDDGNINNGSPNGCDIDDGFGQQGFPTLFGGSGVAIGHTVLAEMQGAASWIEVTATAQAGACIGGGPADSMDLFYSVDNGAYNQVAMVPTGNANEFRGLIPPQDSPAVVYYYLEGMAGAASSTTPDDAPGDDRYVFYVGDISNVAMYDFEAAGDQGWTHVQNATQDDWQRDLPKGKTTDPNSAYSGTNVWANDVGNSGWNGEYANNVDNALFSPVFDFSGQTGLRLQFRRWLTVEAGEYDQATLYVNGNQIFQNPFTGDLLDDHWTLQEYDLSAYDNNPSVQFEFQLESDGGVVYGGWNIDDFRVLTLAENDSGCALPSNYGTGYPGTGGITPIIYSTGGPPEVGNAAFTLIGDQMLPNTTAMLLVGLGQLNLPFNGVDLLVDFTSGFVKGFPSGPLGRVTFASGIPNNAALDGLTVDMQFLVVDPGGSEGWASTSGLEMTICDLP